MADPPKPPVSKDLDVSDLPYPRGLFIELLIEAGCPRADAERLVDDSLGSLARVH